MNSVTPQDMTTVPWYKQFWPWFLIALPGTVVVACIITIVIANKYNDPVVIDDYYKAGLAINQTLDRIELAKQYDITANIQYANTLLTVTLNTNTASAIKNIDTLTLRFTHPTQRKQDISLQLKYAGLKKNTNQIKNINRGENTNQYKFIGQLNTIPATNWYLQLEPTTNNNNNWRLDGRIKITTPSQLDNTTLISK